MKKLIYILSLMLLLPAVMAYDLSDFPEPFISWDSNGYPNFNSIVVVGSTASAEHVIALTNILASLQPAMVYTHDNMDEIIPIPLSASKLDTQITDVTASNLISVGSACNNRVTEQLLGNPASCAEGLTEGIGVIKMFDTGRVAIAVMGYNDDDMRKAANVLANWDQYSLTGKEVCVGGTRTNPEIVSCLPVTCTEDSDGGRNHYIKGTVRSSVGSRTDYCTNTGLLEYYCKSNELQSESYNCPYGCSGGSCIVGEQGITIPESGEYIFKMNWFNAAENARISIVSPKKDFIGQYYGYYPPVEEPFSLGHFSKGDNLLFSIFSTWHGSTYGPVLSNDEAYFKTENIGGAQWKFTFEGPVNFNNNYDDGSFEVYLERKPKCSDSDSGKNYYTHGCVTVSLISGTGGSAGVICDSCSGDVLIEQYCDGNSAASVRYTCPNGCGDGVCYPVPEECVSEGGKGFNNDICCEGLSKISNSWPVDNGCIAPSDGSFICARCGNGVCGKGENTCNCAQDCKAENLPPVIDSLAAPTQLRVNEVGTWRIQAHDPENGPLTYSVSWGDERYVIDGSSVSSEEMASQTTTFTHSYSRAGTYTISFTVTDNHHQEARSTTTIMVVGEGPVPKCADSDGGKDYYVKGDVVHNGIRYHDACEESYDSQGHLILSTGVLSEVYCSGEAVLIERFTCPDGCRKSACVKYLQKIHNFQLKEGYYTFDMYYIFDDFYIDDIKVDVKKAYMGGAAHTLYKIPCKEGKKLEAIFVNPVSGHVTLATYDISKFECGTSACTDSDGGKNHYVEGVVYDPKFPKGLHDSCIDSTTLNEYACYFYPAHESWPAGYYGSSTKVKCPNGCSNGACKPIPESPIEIEEFPTEPEEPIPVEVEPEEYPIEIEPCEGCLKGGICLSTGIRTVDSKGMAVYCDIDNTMKQQKQSGSACQNNFECQTNTCSSGRCVDLQKQLEEQKNLLEKIWNWLSKIF